ncbi:unnamed protein product [Paramecium sonneborni]|uniref:C3H1-type domain-containing protein n=1 Tax=Paramecium sonneborni TaxID=65129 RepID=A0A8S1K9G2_9CILI|nr:unnamed protein product [Paramecium sonneborni]
MHNFAVDIKAVDQYELFQFNNLSTDTGEDDEFELGVKPKKKLFNSSIEKQLFIEEYTKKKKTELCKNFMLKNTCKFGLECSYAHGYSELLPKGHLHKNYKTKACKNFLNNGFCNYGARCQYIHPENTISIKNLDKKNYNDIQANIPKITENKCQSIQKKNLLKNITDFVTYSEILYKFNFSPKLSVSNLPRLRFFRQLSKKNICFLSHKSDL